MCEHCYIQYELLASQVFVTHTVIIVQREHVVMAVSIEMIHTCIVYTLCYCMHIRISTDTS